MKAVQDILQLVEDGALSPSDAQQRLSEIDTSIGLTPTRNTWCIVTVFDQDGKRPIARTRLPIALVVTALRMNTHFIPQPEKAIFDQLLATIHTHEKGIVVEYPNHQHAEVIRIEVE